MRQLVLLGALVMTGCNLFAPRSAQRVDDPRLPIYEQERRGRDRLSLPENAPNLTPRTGLTGTVYR